MKNMTAGALATGLGVALLVGGGGTLAVWNQDASAAAGTIVAGNLDLQAGTGTWKNAAGDTVDLAKYKAVPGDKLTLTQPVTVALEGDKLAATLAITDALDSDVEYLTVGKATLTDAATQEAVTGPLTQADDAKTYNATVTVTFETATTGRTGAGLSNDLGQVGFFLEQQAPAAS